MQTRLFVAIALLVFVAGTALAQTSGPPNPAIDMDGYLRIAAEAAKYRETRRLTEDEFIRLSRETGTIVLDARSKQKFDDLHIKGAINLSFPDITVESLKSVLPDKNARILIYCNNNLQTRRGRFQPKWLPRL